MNQFLNFLDFWALILNLIFSPIEQNVISTEKNDNSWSRSDILPFINCLVFVYKGLELQEFYQRRKPTDMSKYYGKSLIDVEQPPRWHQVNPKDWNDPWVQKFSGKEVNYIGKVW